LKQSEIKDALRKTAYAISTDETRYVLNGVLFSFKDSRLTMVATDGRRLALVDLEVEFPQSDEVEIIVPTKCINELTRLVSENGDLKMMVGQNQIAFDVGSTRLVSKLVEGNYPNYRQVIPTEISERVTLERVNFLAAVHRVSLLASEKSNSVKLILNKNNLEIAANTPDVGEARESIPVVYKGKDITIAFNPEYLMAPLRALPNDEVFLDLIDEMSPGVIKIQSPFLYVLMPMRVG
jgi:DNA polymerase-3 subunit beta